MMTVSLALFVAMLVLVAVGVYLLLDRSLTRVLLGFLLVGNGVNLLLFLLSDGFGGAPIVGESEPGKMSDPLPQAFILTSIVITFAVSAFFLALMYRNWVGAGEAGEAADAESTSGEPAVAVAAAASSSGEAADEAPTAGEAAASTGSLPQAAASPAPREDALEDDESDVQLRSEPELATEEVTGDELAGSAEGEESER